VSPTFQELPPRTQTTQLQGRVDRLKASMEWAAEAVNIEVRDEVWRTIKRCDERLALGVDHTIVALAGGTGSGKSSLFNAVVGTDFAVVGVSRPTTSEVSAAAWGNAEPLLAWLGVDVDRRLIFGAGGQMDGVVLLDLPDHDSINLTNRDTVDRVVPLADLIVWVVDPQKYADHALHSAYLKVASDHGQPSLIVLNHTDRLSDADAVAVSKDLARLVKEEGIGDAPVMRVSARTGKGVDALRAEIAGAAATRSVAAEAVRADLVAAGRVLEGALARDAEPELPDVDGLVAACARAAGIEARADAAAAVAAGRSVSIPDVLGASLAAVEQVRLEWIDAATAGLPLAWRIVVDDAVFPAAALAGEINVCLGAVTWPPVEPPKGLRGLASRASKGRAAGSLVRTLGREAIMCAVVPHVVEPTDLIHQAYRNLDELTELT
jgi:GTP-binding protein EngB required for normal cell division